MVGSDLSGTQASFRLNILNAVPVTLDGLAVEMAEERVRKRVRNVK